MEVRPDISLNISSMRIVPCNSFSFLCKIDMVCVSLSEKCDGKFDCIDKTDEKNCTKLFTLIHPKTNNKINPLYFCDLIQNYPEREDEKICGITKLSR